jgi:hypothetical protein
MSKQYRVSLPTGRTELAQVLARLQDDTLQGSDRQLLMYLVQQLLGSSAGTPLSGPTTTVGEKAFEPTADSSKTTSPEPENKESKRLGHGRKSVETIPVRSAYPATIRSGRQAIDVRAEASCTRPRLPRYFFVSPVSL